MGFGLHPDEKATRQHDEIASLRQSVVAMERKIDGLCALLSRQRKDHLTVEEVAELTGRSEYTIRRWVSEGRLTAIRLAEGGPRGRLLIARGELDRLVAAGIGGNIPASALSYPCNPQ